jgi:HAMP domain-containing protein
MASEPKKPIEQMLEALAKARRAEFGDDPKMPNPMRVRLHEEIAQVGAAEEENVESRQSWVTRFWPRVTVAAALATLIVLVPAIWWNQSHPLGEVANVAVRDRSGVADGLNPAPASEDTLAKAPAVSATEPTVNLADNNQTKIEPASTPASEAGALASSTRVLQGRGTTEFPNQVSKGFDKEIAAAKIQAAPAVAPAAGADSKAKSDKMAGVAPPVAQPSLAGSLGTRQQFSQQSAVQSFRNNAQVSRAANVLNTFQVQQQGSEIRVLDADGSTYTGKIEQSAKNAELDSRVTSRRDAAKQTQRYAAKAARENESAAPQSYFRATGFNVSLKKTLVFEGNYAAPPAQQPATATANDRERSEQSRDRTRIVGTVRVNGEAPVEVDAIAETPEAAATKKSEN